MGWSAIWTCSRCAALPSCVGLLCAPSPLQGASCCTSNGWCAWGLTCKGFACLAVLQIVAVPSLQSGGMENVGLNTFDASHILACPATATDDDYQNVEREWIQAAGALATEQWQYMVATAPAAPAVPGSTPGLQKASRISLLLHQHSQCAGTVAHEFFHHQTGNRVTVRDWFQVRRCGRQADEGWSRSCPQAFRPGSCSRPA